MNPTAHMNGKCYWTKSAHVYDLMTMSRFIKKNVMLMFHKILYHCVLIKYCV